MLHNPTTSLWLSLWVVACVCTPDAARAHGPPPALVRPVVFEGSVPVALTLSKGVVHRREDGKYAYLCPYRWGGPEQPSAAAPTSTVLTLAGLPGLVRFDRTRSTFSPPHPELTASRVRGFWMGGDALVALTLEPAGTATIWDVGVEDTSPRLTLEEDWATLALEGADVLLARTRAERFEFERRAPDGKVLQAWSQTLSNANFYPVFRKASASRTLILLRGVSEHRLVEVTGSSLTEILVSELPITGVAEVGGRLWISRDGHLHEVLEGGTLSPAFGEDVRCLGPRPEGGAYVCQERALLDFELSGDSPRLETVLFSFDQIVPPPLAGLDTQTYDECVSEWLDFALEADIDLGDTGLTPPDAEAPGVDGVEPRPRAREDCSVSSHSPVTPGLWGVAFLGMVVGFLSRRRS